MHTARIIATLDCDRACSYCVNQQEGILEQAKPLVNLAVIGAYKFVCITGGEPTLYPDKLLHLITNIRKVAPKAAVYLYAANFTDVKTITILLRATDGLTYTLHQDATRLNVVKFHSLQDIIRYGGLYLNKSYHLVIMSGMENSLYISPWVWSRIQMQPPNLKCHVPDDEQLYMLAPDYWGAL